MTGAKRGRFGGVLAAPDHCANGVHEPSPAASGDRIESLPILDPRSFGQARRKRGVEDVPLNEAPRGSVQRSLVAMVGKASRRKPGSLVLPRFEFAAPLPVYT